MAYVRKRGNQLVIAHGEREPGTGKVQQRILFTLYSKPEALEALGKGGKDGAARFQSLLEHRYPHVRFNWDRIAAAIEEKLDVLPEAYAYRGERLRSRFRQDLCAFTRQLILADPQDLTSAAELIRDQRLELEYLSDLIRWRLQLCDTEETEWTADNPYFWRFTLSWRGVPPDTEAHAADLYERGEYERAEAIFGLLIDCFDGYAEGYNYLGLIALDRGRLDEAIGHFEKTVELGRQLFPRRIAQSRYWEDHSTRPYMRGLRNLALALNRAGRYDQALAVSNRLEAECGDDLAAATHRAAIYLNTGRWQPAADAALRLIGLWPSESLVAALALWELGRRKEAVECFLYGALNHPRAARMVVGERTARPKRNDEIEDHNTGVSLRNSLHAYVGRRAQSSRRFFRQMLRDPRVVRLLEEVQEVTRMDREQQRTAETFHRLQNLRSREFAEMEAWKLQDLVEPSGSHPETAH